MLQMATKSSRERVSVRQNNISCIYSERELEITKTHVLREKLSALDTLIKIVTLSENLRKEKFSLFT